MQFTLQKVPATLAHVNLGEEMHGDEPVLRFDLKLTADVGNDFLSQLDPTLKAALYRAEGEGSSLQAPLLDDGTHLPVLRFPSMGVIPWEGKMPIARVLLHGARKKDEVTIDGDVDKIRLVPKEGGTVELTFRVQFQPLEEQLGAVPLLLQQKQIKVSVRPNDAPDSPPESAE
jgi:hypothetical protein